MWWWRWEWYKRAMTLNNWSLGSTECKTISARLPKRWSPTEGLSAETTIVAMTRRAIEYIAPCVDEAGKGQSSYDSRGVSAEYHSSQFVYDAQSNSYRCPQGKILSMREKKSATCS